MRLPNGENAQVDERKLIEYALDPAHPVGKHKARVFAAALGLTLNDAPRLRQALLGAASTGDADLGKRDEHGQRYRIDFAMSGINGDVMVRSVWVIRTGEDYPRLVTCHVLQ